MLSFFYYCLLHITCIDIHCEFKVLLLLHQIILHESIDPLELVRSVREEGAQGKLSFKDKPSAQTVCKWSKLWWHNSDWFIIIRIESILKKCTTINLSHQLSCTVNRKSSQRLTVVEYTLMIWWCIVQMT